MNAGPPHHSGGAREEELRAIDACIRGDVERFAPIFEAYRERVYYLALSIVKEQSLAKDVAQASFIKAFKALKWFNRRSSFSTWLFRITYNEALDAFRRRKRREEREPAGEETTALLRSPGPDPFQRLAGDELRERVAAAVRALPVKLRTSVVLRYGEGLTFSEICSVMGCARGVLQRRLARAHAIIRDILGPESEGAGK
ncbi:MAG: sigma-70 family RNA polymerase sigma factor [bacterium]|nr:sigma-70 family RNA polymerase sigma factor [bacterium]